MPFEVKDWSEFVEIAKRALECRVKKNEKQGVTKIKARTRRMLYTIKLETLDDAEIRAKVEELDCPRIVYIDTGEVVEKKKE